MNRRVEVRRNRYYDSVRLMRVSESLQSLPGIATASTVMGTEMNRDLLIRDGFSATEVSSAGPDDLIVAVAAGDIADLDTAMSEIDRALAARAVRESLDRVPLAWSDDAFRRSPGTNIVVIAVPGEYAALEAWAAIRSNRHAFIFSDNVPLADEVALKRAAAHKGLLVMGPDCGTAILGGAGLGFANRVRRGAVGLVGGSGTGIQQVSCLIDALGGGIGAAIGTGSRDMSAEVGGIMTMAGIDVLAADNGIESIGLISKPADPAVASTVIRHLARSGKPAVACLLGADAAGDDVRVVSTLAEAAAALMGRGPDPVPALPPSSGQSPRDQSAFVTGLFCGGTLCQEAMRLLSMLAPGVGSRFVDVGGDEYTRGRPHPMIDPRIRSQLIVEAASTTDVLLVDVVLGDLAHPDPAGVLVPAVEEAAEIAARGGRRLETVAILVGTAADPQNLDAQRSQLEAARVAVFPSGDRAIAHAATLALRGRTE